MSLHFIFILFILGPSAAFPFHQGVNGTLSVNSRVGDRERSETNSHRQEQEEQCLMCSQLGTEFLPEALLFSHLTSYTCVNLQQDILPLSPTSDLCKDTVNAYQTRCCLHTYQLQNYECATNVRSSIINDSYDINVAPVQTFNGISKAVDVETMITFLAVKELDLLTSTLEIFVVVDLQWIDPRLAWNVSSANCATQIDMRADFSREETEIWIPKFDLENRATSVQDFPSNSAIVQSDGTVSWTRLGSLRAICAFVGLERMPFDDMGCRLIFGNNDNGIPMVDYRLKETPNNLTKGFSHWDVIDIGYAEFSIVDEKSRTHYSNYSGNFYIDLFFRRARSHYVIYTIIPNIIFTYVSFGQFTFETHAADRLMFSITIVLIIVTQSILTATLLPTCNELLWLNAFNLVSMFFTLLGIFESLAVYLIHRLVVSQEREEKEKEEEEEYVNLIPKDSKNNVEEDSADLNVDAEEGKEEEISLASDEKKDIFSRQSSSLIAIPEVHENIRTPQNPTPCSIDEHDEVLSSPNPNLKPTRSGLWSDRKIVRMFKAKAIGNGNRAAPLLQQIDFYFFMVLPMAYTIFILVMFLRNSNWEVDPTKRWSNLK